MSPLLQPHLCVAEQRAMVSRLAPTGQCTLQGSQCFETSVLHGTICVSPSSAP